MVLEDLAGGEICFHAEFLLIRESDPVSHAFAGERITFDYLLMNKYIGDTASITLQRCGKVWKYYAFVLPASVFVCLGS
jgi:hypothetical protein